MIELRVLGTLAILPANGIGPPLQLTQPKRIALLLYLALAEPAGVQSRESLMALLWPEASDESARHSLRNTLYGLRQVLGEDAICTHGEGYVGLSPTAIHCDVLDVRRELNAERWEGALFAWRGELAPAFHVTGAPDFERWLDEQRANLRRAITRAAWHRVDELEQSGDAAVVPAARRAWALDPADEAGARRLLVLLDAKIGKAAALRAYDELVEQLRRELDSDPSPETRALAAQLKARREPRADVVSAALSAAVPSPNAGAAAERSEPAAINAAIGAASLVRARRVTPTVAFAAGVLLIAAVSLLALRPGRPAARLRPVSPVERAEREGALRLAQKYRQDTASYGAYLRGLTLRLTGEHTASRDTFAALVARNPLYAPGYAGLAHAYLISVVNGEIPSAEGYAKADAAALKAIALDSTVASAYLALGMTEIAWRWDIRGAGALLNRGLALDPGDPEAHILRGNWFKWQGNADSAVAEYRMSYAVDPLSSSLRDRVARALLLARHTAEAEAMYRRTIEEYPRQTGAYFGLSDVYLFTARPRDALNALRMGWAVAGDTGALARVPPAKSDTQALRVFDDEARQSLRDLKEGAGKGEWVPANAFADTYAALHDTSETLRWLDSMVARHDSELCCVRMLPQFDFLRNNPRYISWEARLPWLADGAKVSDSAR